MTNRKHTAPGQSRLGRRDALKLGGLTLSAAAFVAACGDDRGGDAPRESFVTVAADHLGESALLVPVDDVVGRPARIAVHSHVERAGPVIRETTRRLIQLVGRNAKVE